MIKNEIKTIRGQDYEYTVSDGGFMINSQELETVLRCELPLVVLILNDNAYGFVKWKQQKNSTNRITTHTEGSFERNRHGKCPDEVRRPYFC